MRHLLSWLVLIGLASAVIYYVQNPHRAEVVLDGLPLPASCPLPLTLHPGEFDERFPFSEETFHQTLEEAIAIWEADVDTPLFRLTDSSGMPVNLVFDERQRAANEREQRESEFDRTSRDIEQRRDDLDERQDALNREWSQYRDRHEGLNDATDALNEEVRRWNSGQLAQTSSNRERIKAERRRIETKRQRLERQHQELEQQTAQVQAAFRSLNSDIDRFNHRSQSERDQRPSLVQAGQFRQLGNFRTIDVFLATDTDRLRLVLAHELGHALGLDHVDSPEAVMHETTTEANAHRRKLSEADRRALQGTCGTLSVRQ